MKNIYEFFNRDVSWLSFNYRVLLEATNYTLPIYERVNFLAIYSSNLEEFYEVRVAQYRAVVAGLRPPEDYSQEESRKILKEITRIVNEQQIHYYRIFYHQIVPLLSDEGIILNIGQEINPKHSDFIRDVFRHEVLPYLTPHILQPGEVNMFIRDKRIYLIVRMRKKEKDGTVKEGTPYIYGLLKIPGKPHSRFIQLPELNGLSEILFVDDVIRFNLDMIFPAYEIDNSYTIKVSRDADLKISEKERENLPKEIRKELRKRNTGDMSRFMYDRAMPDDFLDYICSAFDLNRSDLVISDRYHNLQDLIDLPNPKGKHLELQKPEPLPLPFINNKEALFPQLLEQDLIMHFPYHSFSNLIQILEEAAEDPRVREIKITQYRVAENSAVVNELVKAANNGKEVTVFVELKARFDEENNLKSAVLMRSAGIKIIHSIPRLKVHAKFAVLSFHKGAVPGKEGFACITTGNFNEKTAQIYSDIALFTTDTTTVRDLLNVFKVLEGEELHPNFNRILVAQFNMASELNRMIDREIEAVRKGEKGKIILKMNGLQDESMIAALYRASEAGVEIDLLVRGICCLKPKQVYSRNIRVTRIVDMYLEHARIWYFHNGGNPNIYLASADWMKRNLRRRIETAAQIMDPRFKELIIKLLHLQIKDNVNACTLDQDLTNLFKSSVNQEPIRSQIALRSLYQDLLLK